MEAKSNFLPTQTSEEDGWDADGFEIPSLEIEPASLCKNEAPKPEEVKASPEKVSNSKDHVYLGPQKIQPSTAEDTLYLGPHGRPPKFWKHRNAIGGKKQRRQEETPYTKKATRW